MPRAAPPGDEEEARRLRAAFAYAGLPKKDRATVLGVSERQVHRFETGERRVPAERWPNVAEATNVPAWFFESGFSSRPEPEEPTVAEQVEALGHRLDADRQAMARRLNRLHAAVGALVGRDLQQARELLAQDETDHPGELPGDGAR